MMNPDIFFIGGCQRSGTTLLRLILESHSKINCYDEAEGYKILTSENGLDKISVATNHLTGFKIPRFTEQLLWENMSDVDYGSFPNFYKNNKIIFMIRDYRDVVHSMSKLKYDDGDTWLKKYGLTILENQAGCPAFTQENHRLLSEIKNSGAPDHLVGALYWKYKTEALFPLIDAGKPVLPMRYESLVADPRSELLKLVEFMGVDWEDDLLEHGKQKHSELDENGLAIGGTDPTLAIHDNSIQSYKNYFSSIQLEEMHNIVSNTLADLKALGIEFI